MMDILPNTISCVYANTISRRCLWQQLTHISTLIHENWFVIADFNAYFGVHEKTGSPPRRRSCIDFLKVVDSSRLYCLDINGPLYTWYNNRWGRD